jgi:ABC-type dipeptide/oligopeptide/nickel transport system permease component
VNKNAAWYGKDILSVKQFDRADLEYVFGVAHEMRGMVERVGTFDLLKGKILANLFYEPSTRTSSSFTAAMERLGGSVIVEIVYAVPGLGSLMIGAVLGRDYNVIQGLTLFYALATVLVTLTVDILSTLLDPRVKL